MVGGQEGGERLINVNWICDGRETVSANLIYVTERRIDKCVISREMNFNMAVNESTARQSPGCVFYFAYNNMSVSCAALFSS